MFTLHPTSFSETCRGKLIRLTKGTTIFAEGDPAEYWYEVVSGMVRTCRFHSDGHRQLTAFHYPGDVFGVDDERYQETAETMTEVRLYKRRSANVDEAGRDGGSEFVLRRALHAARDFIFLLGHKSAKQRLAAFLLRLAARSERDATPDLMSRNDIADHLGLTMHTVSRTIAELAREGYIQLRGRQCFRILDKDGLRHLAGEDGPEWDHLIAPRSADAAGTSPERIFGQNGGQG